MNAKIELSHQQLKEAIEDYLNKQMNGEINLQSFVIQTCEDRQTTFYTAMASVDFTKRPVHGADYQSSADYWRDR